jgi:hypothetical protein
MIASSTPAEPATEDAEAYAGDADAVVGRERVMRPQRHLLSLMIGLCQQGRWLAEGMDQSSPAEALGVRSSRPGNRGSNSGIVEIL